MGIVRTVEDIQQSWENETGYTPDQREAVVQLCEALKHCIHGGAGDTFNHMDLKEAVREVEKHFTRGNRAVLDVLMGHAKTKLAKMRKAGATPLPMVAYEAWP